MILSSSMGLFEIVISSAAICAAVIFSFYVLFRRTGAPGFILVVALLPSSALEIFDLLALIQPERLFLWKKLALFAEGCLPSSWLFFALTYARQREMRAISLLQRSLLVLSLCFAGSPLVLPVGSLFYSPDFSQERILFLGEMGFAFYTILLVYMVVALINLEITFANASRAERWNIKFEVLGTGFFLAALVFYYSQGFLYRTINMNLAPVRSVALLVSVLFIFYSRMRQSDGVKIHISRHVAYRSVVLLAVAFYLIGLGLVGEGMRYFGESFPRSLVVALSLVVGIGIVTILLSETVKRKITAFLNRNFYQDKYDYRVQWLDFTDRLSSARTGDELLTGILSGYCETFGMGGGALFLSDNSLDGYSLVAKLEMEPSPWVSGGDPFVACMLAGKHVVNMGEVAREPMLAKNEFLEKNDVSLSVPLFLHGLMHGFILLVRPLNTTETYSTEDYDLMKTLAHQTSSAILNLRLSDQLAQAKEMEVLGRVSTFVVHDLKNLVYTVSLILDNAKDYIAEPDFQQDMLASLGNTVDKMKTLIAKLKYLPETRGLNKKSVDLLRLMEEAAATVTGAGVRVIGSSVMAEVDRDEMHKVALNLLLNAVDATDGPGTVVVEVGKGEQAFIRVTDEGCGIPEEFLRRDLFSPFKSTKKSGLGIGLYQCKQIVEAHNGTIEVESEVGKGSVFTVRIPAEQV